MANHETSMKCTGGGPKPPSPNPDTLDILSMIPQEFETDFNIFDSDGIASTSKKEEPQLIHIKDLAILPVENENHESQLGLCAQEFVLTEVDNREKTFDQHSKDETKENITPSTQQQSGIKKRKLPFSNGHRSTSMDDSTKERNQVLINCLREEHHLKMKNMAEAHNLLTEEHKLKIKQMSEHHDLLKEESCLRIEKLKLEISLLK